MVAIAPPMRKVRTKRDARPQAGPSTAQVQDAPLSLADRGDLEALLMESREELARLVRLTEREVTSSTLARETAERERSETQAAVERLRTALSIFFSALSAHAAEAGPEFTARVAGWLDESGLVDAAYQGVVSPDMAPAGVPPALHYLLCGAAERRLPDGLLLLGGA